MSDRQLSAHFKRSEFACSCGCGFDSIDVETLEILEAVRTGFDAPVIVTSGARCEDYNRQVGGAENSQHLVGRAADIKVKGATPDEVSQYVIHRYPHASIGLYRTFVHIDTRTNGPARWER